MLAGPDIEHADEIEGHGHCEHANHVDGAAAEIRHQAEPVDQGSEEGQPRAAKVERIGGFGGKADLLEEVGCIVSEGRARQNLAGEADACNFRPPKLESREAVEVAGADGKFFF